MNTDTYSSQFLEEVGRLIRLSKSWTTLALLFFTAPGFLQGQDSVEYNIQSQKNSIIKSLSALHDLSQAGLTEQGDSVIASPELIRLLEDSTYRDFVYPQEYTWEQASRYISELEVKKALWFFINLYPESEENKEKVILASLSLGKKIKIDQALTNTFSTYCYTDPEISEIVNGETEIRRPDILEEKMRDLKELLHYIRAMKQSK